jgi:hypothetical protein
MSEDPKLFVHRISLGAAASDWSFSAHPEEAEFNLFRYCGNDPIDFVDPMGLEDIPISRERDIRMWQASMNSLEHAQHSALDRNGKQSSFSQYSLPDGKGHWHLENRFNESTATWVKRDATSGQNHSLVNVEGGERRPINADIGHVHMDVTGHDQSNFSIGKVSDYHTAEQGTPVAKVNQSSSNAVTRLTPQTDGAKPQIREIKPPTAAELKKYGN